MQEVLNRVVVVLDQPQDLVNVASIIRVMSNFGLSQLRLVEPAAFDPYRILGIAHHTEALVDRVQRFESLAEATADCALVLGTTGRPRAAERLVLSPRQAAPFLLAAAGGKEPDAAPQQVAVLFGTERTGLSNEALDACHGIVCIPTHAANPSLNLAQATLVLAYELFQSASAPEAAPPPLPTTDLAPGEERETMFHAVADLLTALYPGTTPERLGASVARLRAMLMRSAPTTAEAQAFTNLCRHAVRRLRDHR